MSLTGTLLRTTWKANRIERAVTNREVREAAGEVEGDGQGRLLAHLELPVEGGRC
jgi:hypothetical protein